MTPSFRSALLSALVSVSLAAPAFAAEEGAATAFVQSRADVVVSLVNGAGASEARRAELRDAIRGFLSYDVLAERTLGEQWGLRSADERAEFVALLRDLIETSYSRKLGRGPVDATGYGVSYTGERTRRDRTTVEVQVTAEGRAHVVEIKLEERAEGFIVYDVVTDDVSLEESYAESFASIIAERGWDGLIARMRERLEELQRG